MDVTIAVVLGVLMGVAAGMTVASNKATRAMIDAGCGHYDAKTGEFVMSAK